MATVGADFPISSTKSNDTLKRIHIVGRKNSGKTTLIVEIVECLTAQGFKVGTIKHTHHHHELDVPGKDSHRHRLAGAATVAILSPNMTAVYQCREAGRGPARYARLQAAFVDCDLVLVEGDLATTAVKVEVYRKAVGDAPYAATNPAIAALISDDAVDLTVPRWPRQPVADIAAQILALANRQQ